MTQIKITPIISGRFKLSHLIWTYTEYAVIFKVKIYYV